MSRSPFWRRFSRPLFRACIVVGVLLAMTIALSYLKPIGGTVSRVGIVVDRSLLSVVQCTHELDWDDPNPPGNRSGTAAWRIGGNRPVAWVALAGSNRPELELAPARRSARVSVPVFAGGTSSAAAAAPAAPPIVITLSGWNIPLLPYLALLLIATSVLWHFGPRRRAAWECEKCGYDLRGATGRCPECGERSAPAS